MQILLPLLLQVVNEYVLRGSFSHNSVSKAVSNDDFLKLDDDEDPGCVDVLAYPPLLLSAYPSTMLPPLTNRD